MKHLITLVPLPSSDVNYIDPRLKDQPFFIMTERLAEDEIMPDVENGLQEKADETKFEDALSVVERILEWARGTIDNAKELEVVDRKLRVANRELSDIAVLNTRFAMENGDRLVDVKKRVVQLSNCCSEFITLTRRLVELKQTLVESVDIADNEEIALDIDGVMKSVAELNQICRDVSVLVDSQHNLVKNMEVKGEKGNTDIIPPEPEAVEAYQARLKRLMLIIVAVICTLVIVIVIAIVLSQVLK